MDENGVESTDIIFEVTQRGNFVDVNVVFGDLPIELRPYGDALMRSVYSYVWSASISAPRVGSTHVMEVTLDDRHYTFTISVERVVRRQTTVSRLRVFNC